MKRFVITVAAAVGLCLAAAGCGGGPGPEGIYLCEGGLGYLVIAKDGSGYKIAEPGWLPLGEVHPTAYDGTLRVDRGELRIEFQSRHEANSELRWEPSSYCGILRMEPSRGAPRDFDLVGFRETDSRLEGEPPQPAPPMLKVRFPSFLHRLDDARIPAYFEAQRTANDPARAFDPAAGLLASFPNDLHVRALYLEAALKKRDFAVFEARLKEWGEAFLRSDDPYLRRIPGLAEYVLESKRLTDAGKNAWTIITYLMGPNHSKDGRTHATLAEWIARAPEIGECENCLYEPKELNPARMDRALDNYIHNYPGMLVVMKAISGEAMLRMFEGKREEALRLIAAGLYLGKWSSETGDSLNRVIGTAIKAIYLARLSLFALNACESVEELRAVARVLERVREGPRTMTKDDLALFFTPNLAAKSEAEFVDDYAVRFGVSVAKFEVLRTVVGARMCLLESGDFPRDNAELARWIDGGMPGDPFAGEKPIRHFVGTGGFTAYSVGPDGDDDGGEIGYDPTNGSRSSGDNFTRVPREREFPFSREGLHARTVEDVQRQFPNGLPADIFAKTKGRALGIDAGPPVRIYSFGPNNDEVDPMNPNATVHEMEAMYDPTNGWTSDGDLFIEIPE